MLTPQMQLKIRYYGDAALRKRAKALEVITEEDRQALEEMSELMRLSCGVGLAAPQVGINKQMLLVDIGEGLVTLVNPRITKKSGSEMKEEGCLSLPGVYVKVRRAKRVTVTGLNEKGEKVCIHAYDIFARALQHEIDHLRGKLIIDYANFIHRIGLKKKLKNFTRSQACGLF